MMGVNILTSFQVVKNKRKGFAYEAELVDRAKEFGLEAKRAWGSNGESLGCDATVDLIISDYKIQAKRCKKVLSKYEINEHQDAVVYRGDGSLKNSQIMLRFDVFLELIKKIDYLETKVKVRGLMPMSSQREKIMSECKHDGKGSVFKSKPHTVEVMQFTDSKSVEKIKSWVGEKRINYLTNYSIEIQNFDEKLGLYFDNSFYLYRGDYLVKNKGVYYVELEANFVENYEEMK